MGFLKSYINIHITSKYFPHDNKQTLHQYYRENCAKRIIEKKQLTKSIGKLFISTYTNIYPKKFPNVTL